MQEIIKQVGPSRQLFETVNFAFMKIFDFLVKIAIFEHFFIFWKIRVIRYFPDHVFEWTRNAWRKSPKKWRNASKMAILTTKSKIFLKVKLTVSKHWCRKLLSVF